MQMLHRLAIVVCAPILAVLAAGCPGDPQVVDPAPPPRRPRPEVALTGKLGPRYLWGEKTAAGWLEDLDSADKNVRCEASTWLGSIGEEGLALVPVLIWALEDPAPEVRGSVAWHFHHKYRDAARIAPVLRDLAARDVPDVSKAAIDSLKIMAGDYGRPEALAALLELTKHKRADVRDAAVESLGSARSFTEPPVLRLLALAAVDPPTILGKKAAASLAQLGESAVPGLLAGLEDPSPDVRRLAAQTLAGLRKRPHQQPARSVPALARALRSPQWTTRLAAAGFLADMGLQAGAAAPDLIQALGDGIPGVAAEAARALGTIGPESAGAVPALLQALRSPGRDEVVRSAAARALGPLAAIDDDVLLALLETIATRLGARPSRAEAGGSGDPDAPGVLEGPEDSWTAGLLGGLTLEETEDVRSAAIASIGKLGAGSVSALGGALRHRDPVVREGAAVLLGTIGPDAGAALDALAASTTDPDPRVRAAAADAIGALGAAAKEAAPALRRAFRDADGRVRAAAVRALRWVGPDPSADSADLAGLLDDPATRYEAALALAELGAEGGARAVPILVREAAALFVQGTEAHDALVRLGAAAVPGLLEALDASRRNSLAFAKLASIVEEIGADAKAAVPLLRSALASESSIIRLAAARALGGIGAEAGAAAADLRARLEDPDAGVRNAAKEALAAVGAEPREPPADGLPE